MCREKIGYGALGYAGSGQGGICSATGVNSAPFPLTEIVMKIRTLIAGVALALAIGACASETTLPETPVPAPLFDGTGSPPADTTGRTGGSMGTGT